MSARTDGTQRTADARPPGVAARLWVIAWGLSLLLLLLCVASLCFGVAFSWSPFVVARAIGQQFGLLGGPANREALAAFREKREPDVSRL